MTRLKSNFPDFLDHQVDEVAVKLLGCVLERELPEGIARVRIVEVESYDEEDEASHAYGGETLRNSTMFGSSGHLYVYLSYGIHHCCNIVTGREGYGSGVLIRAVEPIEGIDVMEANRGVSGKNLTNGPGKVCQALGIDLTLKGHDLRKAPLQLVSGSLRPGESVVSTTRIGISKATEKHRRFYIADNPYVSRR